MRICIRSLLIFLAVPGVLAAPRPARADIGADALLNRLADFSAMPRFRDYTAHQASSYQRTGGNGDAQHFLRMEGDEGVMAEMDGPGAIVRIWSANADSAGNLRIYLDDSKTPVIDAPFQNLFNEKMPPFASPIARLSSGGFISYLPIPYSKRCKVTVDKPKGLYYQVTYITFPAGTPVRPFHLPLEKQDQKALEAVQNAWKHPGAPADALPPGDRVRVPAGETVEIAARRGPAVITAFRMKLEGQDGTVLRKLVLRAYFDGHQQADIEAPVADFFGNAYGAKEFRSLFVGQSTGGCYCLLPMPFAKSARFTIENGTGETVAVRVAVRALERPFDPAREGTLHALFLEEKTRRGEPHRWLRLDGARGHFVGQVMAMSGQGLGFLEGDEQFRVDDEQWLKSEVATTVVGPWNGTGTEDYYNSGWYFNKGPIMLPTHGAVVREDEGRVDVYRWHLLDTPSFRKSIDAQIEHGGTNDRPDTYYSSVVFWYQDGEAKPRFSMPKAAALSIPRRFLVAAHNAAIAALSGAGLAARPWEELSDMAMGGKVLEVGPPAGVVEIPVTVATTDRYRLSLEAARSPRYGGVLVTVDGDPVGQLQSLHAEKGNAEPVTIAVGEFPLAAGKHVLRVTSDSGEYGTFGITGYTLASASPMITTWRLSEVFKDNPGDERGLDIVYEPEKHLDNPLANGRWRTAAATPEGWIDLIPQNDPHENVAIYAVAELTAPEETDTQLLLGSDDGVKVWLNGQQVHRHGAPRPLKVDEDVVSVHLKAGRNLIVLKVVQGIGGWAYSVRVRDPEKRFTFAAPK